MLINGDAKALEWLGAVYLSKDKTGYQEIREGIDQHNENQRAFGLPSRLIAKTFVFRLIYGGSAYSYANDADFEATSTSEKFWQQVIDRFYQKYTGIGNWHNQLVETVMKQGFVEIPTGRCFRFVPDNKKKNPWPRTTILNYPVQGFGADLMVLARVELFNRVRAKVGLEHAKFICTVHDSILIDAPKRLVTPIVDCFYETWDVLPALFERKFGIPFDLPTKVEVLAGQDWHNMEEVERG